jgi:hypothetical protein
MAVEVARLTAVLAAQTDDFDRKMSQSETTMQKTSRGISKAARVAGLAIVGGLGVAAKIGWDEYKQGQLVAAQTNAVLESTKGIANVTAKEVQNLAHAISRKSGMDDEAVQSGANLLLTFKDIRNRVGANNRIFDQATNATADLATAMGMDMTKAALQVGKALNDPARGMSRLQRIGVTFTESQKQTAKRMMETGNVAGAQKIILRELQSEFGGSAEAAGKTLPGQLRILRETFADLMGEIVAKVIPKIAALVGFFRDHTTTAKVLGGILGGLVGTMFAVAAGMKVYGAYTKLATFYNWLFVGSAEKAAFATRAWAAMQWVLNFAFRAFPLVGIISGLVLLTGAIILAWKKSETFRDIVIGTWEAVKGAAVAVFDFLREKIGGFIGFLADLVQKHPLVWLITHMGEVRDFISNAIDAIVGFFTGLPGRIWNAIQRLASDVWSWLKGQFTLVVDFYSAKIGDLVGFFRDLPGRISAWIESGLGSLFGEDGLFRSVFRRAINWVGGKVDDIIGFFRDLPGRILAWIESGLATLFGEDGAFRRVFRNAVKWVEDKVGDIVGFFRDLPGRAGEAILDMAGRLKDAVIGLFKKLPGWAQDILGISSPSRVFREIGENVVQGFIDGLQAKAGQLRDKAMDMARGALEAVQRGAGAVAGGGGLGDLANLITLGRRLQAAGFQVGEHPAFGGVSPVHTADSWHYKGRAIDVNWPGGGALELARLTQIFQGLRGDRRILEMMIEDVGRANQHLHIAMAKGGLFTKPWTGLVSVAERGKPEGFFPLDRLGGLTRSERVERGGGLTVNFNGPVYGTEAQELARKVRNALLELQRNGDVMPWHQPAPGFS